MAMTPVRRLPPTRCAYRGHRMLRRRARPGRPASRRHTPTCSADVRAWSEKPKPGRSGATTSRSGQKGSSGSYMALDNGVMCRSTRGTAAFDERARPRGGRGLARRAVLIRSRRMRRAVWAWGAERIAHPRNSCMAAAVAPRRSAPGSHVTRTSGRCRAHRFGVMRQHILS